MSETMTTTTTTSVTTTVTTSSSTSTSYPPMGYCDLFYDGFESGDLSAWTGWSKESAGDSISVVPYQYCEDASLEAFIDGSLGVEWAYAYWQPQTPQSDFWVRFFINLPIDIDGQEIEGWDDFDEIWFYEGTTYMEETPVHIFRIGLYKLFGQTYWAISFLDGISWTNIPCLNLPYVYNPSKWYCIEAYCKVDSTNGEFCLYVDGIPCDDCQTELNNNTYGDVVEHRLGIAFCPSALNMFVAYEDDFCLSSDRSYCYCGEGQEFLTSTTVTTSTVSTTTITTQSFTTVTYTTSTVSTTTAQTTTDPHCCASDEGHYEVVCGDCDTVIAQLENLLTSKDAHSLRVLGFQYRNFQFEVLVQYLAKQAER